MREALFAELQESVRDAVAYSKGAGVLRADRFRRPKKLTPAEIRSIRIKWVVNQLVFAKRLGASVSAVRGWEQGKRRPRGIALQLLSIAKHSPAAFLQKGRYLESPQSPYRLSARKFTNPQGRKTRTNTPPPPGH
jgi:DNA-binding transcriptional regulator YiaG